MTEIEATTLETTRQVWCEIFRETTEWPQAF